MTIGAFAAICGAGIFAGLIYDVGKVLRLLFANKILPTVVIDFITALACGGLFVAAQILFCNFALSGYAFLAYFLGLILQRTTLGFLLANHLQSVYNWFKSKKEKFAATRVGRRIFK